MAFSRGPVIVRDGLVLYYDVANIKSFRGEPTTNVVTNTNLDTGWSKDYQTNIVFNEIRPPDGINSPVVGFDRGNASGYWYSYGNYAPKVPNTIYTVSMYIKTLDSNFTIAYYTADNSETGRVWGSYILVPNDGKWHRIVWPSFTNPSNSQSESLSFNFTYAGSIGSPSTRTWFCAPQMEAKTYVTPFVIGSRGSTVATGGGLIDLSKNNSNGELLGPVFNSSNQGTLSFDGTDDIISIPNSSPINISGNITINCWVRRNTSAGGVIIHKDLQYTLLLNANGTLTYADSSLWSYASFGDHGNIAANQFVNIAVTKSGSTVTIYANGAVVISKTFGGAISQTSNTLYIGSYNNSQNYFNGYISNVSIYNRALTASEVLQNYNATKGRFV